MAAIVETRECFECKRPIATGDPFLEVAGPGGRQQFVHTLCFNDTTFDPDRYDRIPDPDTRD
jgi:hypothetical protein